jgi:signal transduction histidine kinase
VRTRIITLTLLTAMLALGLFGLPLAFGLGHVAVLKEQSSLHRIANFTARSLQDELIHDEAPAELPDPPENTDLAFYDADGDLVIGTGPRSGDDLVADSLARSATRSSDERDLVVTVPVTDGHDVVGVVRAATPIGPVYRELVPAWFGMAALAAVVVFAVWLVARRHARRLARPVEELSVTARRLGDGDFSVRSAPVGVREIDAVSNALNSTAGRLDDLLARERAFSADASHQLRTPLAGLRLRLEDALDSPDEDLRQALLDGLAAADRLEQTIDELLLLAREQPDRRGVPVTVAALVHEIEEGWSRRLAAHGRSLIVDVQLPLPNPRASAASTRQEMAVLLDNAEVHGAGTVHVTVREASDAIAIDVSDEGPGILTEQLNTLPEASPGSGHGIGLALARRLAEADGGRLLFAQSSPPVFTLLLAADWPTEVPAGDPVQSSPDQGNRSREDRDHQVLQP